MLALISEALLARGIRHVDADRRRRAIARARSTRSRRATYRVFLISLKAGGAGLNLTGADTVIHYDPWWNPAAQAQATDRAHRIGQHKPVFVYDLIAAGSVEERIVELQQRKAELAAGIFDESALRKLDGAEIDRLFSPLSTLD